MNVSQGSTMKDKDFIRWNQTNIYANLLQSEDHLCGLERELSPEHGSCVIKHLTVVWGEAMEASKHCEIAQPDLCGFYREFAREVYNLKNYFEDNGFGPDSLNKVRGLRKGFEREIGKDTSQCQLTGCEIDLGGLKMQSSQSFGAFSEEDPYGLGDLVKRCWEKVNERAEIGEFETTAEKFNAAWECIREGDPVPPETIEQMRAAGFEIHPAPVCVLAKMAKDIERAQAEWECTNEGKIHPMTWLKWQVEQQKKR